MNYDLPPCIPDRPLVKSDQQGRNSIQDYGNHKQNVGNCGAYLEYLNSPRRNATSMSSIDYVGSSLIYNQRRPEIQTMYLPLVHDANIYSGSCQAIGAHQACRPSTDY